MKPATHEACAEVMAWVKPTGDAIIPTRLVGRGGGNSANFGLWLRPTASGQTELHCDFYGAAT